MDIADLASTLHIHNQVITSKYRQRAGTHQTLFESAKQDIPLAIKNHIQELLFCKLLNRPLYMKILNHSLKDGKCMDCFLSHRNLRTLRIDITLQKVDDQNYRIGGNPPYGPNITGHNVLYMKALQER